MVNYHIRKPEKIKRSDDRKKNPVPTVVTFSFTPFPVSLKKYPMQYDILVVGGGPAGISTALHLHRLAPDLAARTLVLEKACHPRPKACAGGITGDAEVLLERLGLDVSSIDHTDVTAARFAFAGRGFVYSVPGSHVMRTVRRYEFDAWLFGKARERGIAVSEGTAVRKVTPGSRDVCVSTDKGGFNARVVVGADGSNSVVRRCAFPGMMSRASRTLEVIAPHSGRSSRTLSEASFDFSLQQSGIGGYIWDFPTQVEGRPMRCRGIYDSTVRQDKNRPSLREMLAREMAREGLNLNDHELEGHPIRWFHPRSRLSSSRVILAGDAAGTDYLLGEGISMALGYGNIAAHAIREAFASGDFSFRDYTRRVLCSPLGRTLTIRAMIARIIYNHRSPSFHRMLWWRIQPVVRHAAGVIVLNWAGRMR